MYEVANQASSITGGVDGLPDMPIGALFGIFAFGLDGTTALRLLLRGPGRCCSCWRAAWCTRRSGWRCAAFARTRGACRPSASTCNQRLRAVFTLGGRHRRHRRRAAGADHAVRRHRHAGLPALGRAADHAGARRRRAASTARCSARRSSSSRRITCRASAPITGSSGSAPCWWCWCCSRAAGSWARSTALQRRADSGAADGGRMASALTDRATCAAASAPSPPSTTSRWTIEAGARHALIGPNGAGKTTLDQPASPARCGPTRGEVILGAERVTAPARRTRASSAGMTRTFQINTLFPGLTSLESVALAVVRTRGARRAAVASGGVAAGRRSTRRAELLRVAAARRRRGARSRASFPTASSGCWRSRWRSRRSPRVLLLDEPAAGIPSGESHAAARRPSSAAAPR